MHRKLSPVVAMLLLGFPLLSYSDEKNDVKSLAIIPPTSGASKFDTSSDNWSPINTISSMKDLRMIRTYGKYALALGDVNHVAFYDGSLWRAPQVVQNIDPYALPIIPQYPDNYQSPATWITGKIPGGEDQRSLFYFNGETITPCDPFPFVITDFKKSRLLESHHLMYAIDYKTNRVFSTGSTKWNMIASLPAGMLVTVTTDKADDDLYALELDASNRYFITHLLANQQWDKPFYTNFSPSTTATLRDMMVMGKGNVIGLMQGDTSGNMKVFLSQDAGQHFVDTGNVQIDSNESRPPSFSTIYNGNKSNIFWTIYSSSAPHLYDDTIAYLDPFAKNPAWINIKIPEPMMRIYSWKATDDDGRQLWINGENAGNAYKIYYYDINAGKFTDTQFNSTNTIRLLEASGQGRAYAFGADSNNVKTGFYFDGAHWKSSPMLEHFLGRILMSGTYRSDWSDVGTDTLFKYIVDEPTKNVWIFSSSP